MPETRISASVATAGTARVAPSDFSSSVPCCTSFGFIGTRSAACASWASSRTTPASAIEVARPMPKASTTLATSSTTTSLLRFVIPAEAGIQWFPATAGFPLSRE